VPSMRCVATAEICLTPASAVLLSEAIPDRGLSEALAANLDPAWLALPASLDRELHRRLLAATLDLDRAAILDQAAPVGLAIPGRDVEE
jgi:hypothetical protein